MCGKKVSQKMLNQFTTNHLGGLFVPLLILFEIKIGTGCAFHNAKRKDKRFNSLKKKNVLQFQQNFRQFGVLFFI